MKKLVCSFLTIALLFWTVTPIAFAASDNSNSNTSKYQISELVEKQVVENGVVKDISQFKYQDEKIEIIEYKLNNAKNKYIIKEGNKNTEVVYDKEKDEFLINDEPLKVDVSIKNVKEEDPLKDINEGIISPQAYYENPPYGSPYDYYYMNTSYIDMRISKTLGTIGANALSIVISLYCKTSKSIAYSVAQSIIGTVGIWGGNNYIKCVRANYEHDLSFYKKYYGRFYYDDYYGALATRKTWYYSGMDAL